MTTNDIDAIRAEVARHAAAIGPGGDKAWAAGLLAAKVPALCDEVEQLRAELAKARKDRDEYAEDNTRVAVALIDVQRKLAGLEADHRSAIQANTAYANENAELKAELEQARTALRAWVRADLKAPEQCTADSNGGKQ